MRSLLRPGDWCLAPFERDAHPDHDAAGRAARTRLRGRVGARLLRYPLWAWHWAVPDDPRVPWHEAVRVVLPEAAQRSKAAALACYRSQTEPLGPAAEDAAVVPPGVLAHFQRPVRGAARMTLPDSYFAAMYARSADPWGFGDRWYEERKRAVTLAALPQRRYASAFEPGCSIGVLTAALAPRCDALLATDVSQEALAVAGRRLADAGHVRLERRALPDDWPPGRFDLVVLSELLYYLGADDLASGRRARRRRRWRPAAPCSRSTGCTRSRTTRRPAPRRSRRSRTPPAGSSSGR